MKLFLYGPPGCGKDSSGRQLAQELELPFIDLEQEIENQQDCSIPELFQRRGEAGFRQAEHEQLLQILQQTGGLVLALGGGTLLSAKNRAAVEAAGTVICLRAETEILLEHLTETAIQRPILAGALAAHLPGLLEQRKEHYASFPLQVDTSRQSPHSTAWQIQVETGRFRISGMGQGYDVLVSTAGIERLGDLLREAGISGRLALVSDENVARYYLDPALRSLRAAGYPCESILVTAGESTKNLDTISHLWDGFLQARLDRSSTVLALGGGVVTDLAGFAAATFLRGLNWLAVPSSLLGMVDASLGGKTGFDLPQGKNLAGAFYAPRLVLALPQLLETLPEVELRNGLAEVVKQAIIADPQLFQECARGWEYISRNSKSSAGWADLVRRTIAVKVQVLLQDPYEVGSRAVLNLGHTIGHALEQASDYSLRHGEAVAIGMVIETRLAEALGIAQPGLADTIAQALAGLHLPVKPPPGLDRERIQQLVGVDKKRQESTARFSLPVKIGQVREGIEIEEKELWPLLWSCMDP